MKEETVTLVFLPGLTYKKETWERVIQNLSPGIKYICLDIDQYGASYKDDKLNFDTYPHYLHDRLEQLNVKKPFILVGHSLGGLISLRYTAKFPADVTQIILISTPLRYLKSPLKIYDKLLVYAGYNFRIFRFIIKQLIKLRLYSRRILKKELSKSGLINPYNFLTSGDMRSVTQCYYDLFLYDFEADVKNIQQKVLLIYGTKDKLMLRTKSTDLYREFRNKTIKTFESNHSIPANFPEGVAKAINRFIVY